LQDATVSLELATTSHEKLSS
jgi:hypothetical protein